MCVCAHICICIYVCVYRSQELALGIIPYLPTLAFDTELNMSMVFIKEGRMTGQQALATYIFLPPCC